METKKLINQEWNQVLTLCDFYACFKINFKHYIIYYILI